MVGGLTSRPAATNHLPQGVPFPFPPRRLLPSDVPPAPPLPLTHPRSFPGLSIVCRWTARVSSPFTTFERVRLMVLYSVKGAIKHPTTIAPIAPLICLRIVVVCCLVWQLLAVTSRAGVVAVRN